MAHFFTRNSPFRIRLISQHPIPLLLLEHKERNRKCFFARILDCHEFHAALDAGVLVPGEGHFGAEGPAVVQVEGEVGAARHHFRKSGGLQQKQEGKDGEELFHL